MRRRQALGVSGVAKFLNYENTSVPWILVYRNVTAALQSISIGPE
jgi:hypothetical protein